MSEEGNLNKAKQLLETGADIAGVAVSGALGFFANDPMSAVGAGMLGVALTKSVEMLISDFANRQLSHREKVKVGAVSAFALSEIHKKLENGEPLRDDGFFESDTKTRSAADEIFEGVLIKSKNEHEEKKLRLLGVLYAKIAFSTDISPAEANQLLRVVEQLTYRQVLLLMLYCNKEEFSLRVSDYSSFSILQSNDADPDALTTETLAVLQELMDMYHLGLLAFYPQQPAEYTALLTPTNIIPSRLETTFFGAYLAYLLDVEEPNLDELVPLAQKLA